LAPSPLTVLLRNLQQAQERTGNEPLLWSLARLG